MCPELELSGVMGFNFIVYDHTSANLVKILGRYKLFVCVSHELKSTVPCLFGASPTLA